MFFGACDASDLLNWSPFADAGADQTVIGGTTVTLDGSASGDLDLNDVLTYSWAQTAGTATVTLSDFTAVGPTFTAPSTADLLEFTLTVSDGTDSDFDTVIITVTEPIGAATKVFAGGGVSFIVTDTAQLLGWGRNLDSEVGSGSTTFYHKTPVQVGADTSWAKVTSGWYQGADAHTLTIATDGTLWAWGANTEGQLGGSCTIGTNCATASSPVQVGIATNWTAVAAGDKHSVALNSLGEVYTWGYNFNGQLGDGTCTPDSGGFCSSSSTPTKVTLPSTVVAISASNSSTFAITTAGDLYAWGSNGSSQLGQGATGASSSSPLQVGAGTNWTKVSAGGSHVLALDDTNALYCWGYSTYGQCGEAGASFYVYTPTQVGSATNFTKIAGGYFHSLVLNSLGEIWTAGENTKGQMGNGCTIGTDCDSVTTLTKMGTGTAWTDIATGQRHNLGIKTGGSVWAWGSGINYQLGDGTTFSNSTPTEVVYR